MRHASRWSGQLERTVKKFPSSVTASASLSIPMPRSMKLGSMNWLLGFDQRGIIEYPGCERSLSFMYLYPIYHLLLEKPEPNLTGFFRIDFRLSLHRIIRTRNESCSLIFVASCTALVRVCVRESILRFCLDVLRPVRIRDQLIRALHDDDSRGVVSLARNKPNGTRDLPLRIRQRRPIDDRRVFR